MAITRPLNSENQHPDPDTTSRRGFLELTGMLFAGFVLGEGTGNLFGRDEYSRGLHDGEIQAQVNLALSWGAFQERYILPLQDYLGVEVPRMHDQKSLAEQASTIYRNNLDVPRAILFGLLIKQYGGEQTSLFNQLFALSYVVGIGKRYDFSAVDSGFVLIEDNLDQVIALIMQYGHCVGSEFPQVRVNELMHAYVVGPCNYLGIQIQDQSPEKLVEMSINGFLQPAVYQSQMLIQAYEASSNKNIF